MNSVSNKNTSNKSLAIGVIFFILGIVVGNLIPDFSGMNQKGQSIDSQTNNPFLNIKSGAKPMIVGTEQDLQMLGIDVKGSLRDSATIEGRMISSTDNTLSTGSTSSEKEVQYLCWGNSWYNLGSFSTSLQSGSGWDCVVWW